MGATKDALANANATLASTVASIFGVAAGSGMAAVSPHDTAASIASINTKTTMALGPRLLSIM